MKELVNILSLLYSPHQENHLIAITFLRSFGYTNMLIYNFAYRIYDTVLSFEILNEPDKFVAEIRKNLEKTIRALPDSNLDYPNNLICPIK